MFQIPGGVTAAKGFKAAGIYGGLRAVGEKPDLALVTCDVDAVSAGLISLLLVRDVSSLPFRLVVEWFISLNQHPSGNLDILQPFATSLKNWSFGSLVS